MEYSKEDLMEAKRQILGVGWNGELQFSSGVCIPDLSVAD